MKFRQFLSENTNGIDLTNPDHRGLLSWVKDFIEARHYANTKLVKQLRKSIDKEIKRLKLDKDEVYFYFGDIDNPGQKKNILKLLDIVD